MTEHEAPQPPTIQIIASPPPDDEISLWELWDRIWRGKWLIFIITFLFVALAGVYLATRTGIYRSEALLQIGAVAGQPLENPDTLAAKLYNAYRSLNTQEAKKQLPRLHGVTVEKDAASVLSLIAYGNSPAEAQNYLQNILDAFVKTNRPTYEQALQLRQKQLKALQSHYDSLMKVERQESSHSSSSSVTLLQDNMRLSAGAALLPQISAAQNSLLPANTHPAQVIRKPSYDPAAVDSKKSVILILALLGGLFTGIFVVLLREAIRARPRKGLLP